MAKPDFESSRFLPICLDCPRQILPERLRSRHTFPELEGRTKGYFIAQSYLSPAEAMTHLRLHIETVHKHAPDVLYLLLHQEDIPNLPQANTSEVIFLYAETDDTQPEANQPTEQTLAEQLFGQLRPLGSVYLHDRQVQVSIGQGDKLVQPWLPRKSTKS